MGCIALPNWKNLAEIRREYYESRPGPLNRLQEQHLGETLHTMFYPCISKEGLCSNQTECQLFPKREHGKLTNRLNCRYSPRGCLSHFLCCWEKNPQHPQLQGSQSWSFSSCFSDLNKETAWWKGLGGQLLMSWWPESREKREEPGRERCSPLSGHALSDSSSSHQIINSQQRASSVTAWFTHCWKPHL